MGYTEIFLTGIGLSMDAFAAAVCKGTAMKRFSAKEALTAALLFGGFQALMPITGFFLGKSFERYITALDHWIAFGLLCFIGGRTVFNVLYKDGNEQTASAAVNDSGLKEILILAVATSIDALAVGMTFAFLRTGIFSAAVIIGVTTFVLSLIGAAAGHKFGKGCEDKASVIGGVILIAIGIKILLEHLKNI